MKRLLMFFAVFAMGILVLSCSEDSSTNNSSKAGIYKGPEGQLGDGTAYVWVQLDDNGVPVSYGISFTDNALNNLGDQMSELELQAPAEASGSNIVMAHVDWNPHGHEPKGVYDLPHFDFHFYMVDNSFLDQITGQDSVKCNMMPPDGGLPPGYIMPPGCVPHMGVHAIDATAPEMNGKIFTKTFIYGFYDGQMIFLEPMVTKAMFTSDVNTEMTVKQPQMYPQDGYYPSSMTITHDSNAGVYKITMGSLTHYTM